MTAVLSETAHHRTQGVELVSPDFSPVDHPQDAPEQVQSLEVKPCSPQDSKHLLPATKRHPQRSYDDALKGSDVTKYSAGGFNVVAPLYNPPCNSFRFRKTCHPLPHPQFNSNKALLTNQQSSIHLFRLLYSVQTDKPSTRASFSLCPLSGPWDSNISICRSWLGKRNGCIVVELFIMYIAFKTVKPMDCGFLFSHL